MNSRATAMFFSRSLRRESSSLAISLPDRLLSKVASFSCTFDIAISEQSYANNLIMMFPYKELNSSKRNPTSWLDNGSLRLQYARVTTPFCFAFRLGLSSLRSTANDLVSYPHLIHGARISRVECCS